MRNGGVAISPKYFIFAVPSFSYFFPVPVQVASTSDSPLGKISCSVDPSWDRVPSGNMLAVCSLPWSCISSSSLSQHLLCGFSLFLPILLSTECLLLLFFFPLREVSHTWWMGSAVCCSESVLEPARPTCVCHKATPLSSHKCYSCEQHLDAYTVNDSN